MKPVPRHLVLLWTSSCLIDEGSLQMLHNRLLHLVGFLEVKRVRSIGIVEGNLIFRPKERNYFCLWLG